MSSTPFDPHGTDPAYKVANETRTVLSGAPHRLIIPNYAPFFVNGFSVTRNGVALKEGRDFYFALQYTTATNLCAQMIYGGILLLGDDNAEVTLSYRKLGDDYKLTSSQAMSVVYSLTDEPTAVRWEDVVTEKYFPPVDVQYDIDAWQGENAIVDSLTSVSSSIVEAGPSDEYFRLATAWLDLLGNYINDPTWQAHLNDHNNPDKVTAYTAGALNVNQPAANTALVASRTLSELTTLVQAADLSATDLSTLFKLTGDRTSTAPFTLAEHFGYLGRKTATAEIETIGSLNENNNSVFAKKSVTIWADKAANTPGVRAVISSGLNTLALESEGDTTSYDTLTYNGHKVYTAATIAEVASGIISVDDQVYTKDTATLRWSGSGSLFSPLSAEVIWPIATVESAGVFKTTASLDLDRPDFAAQAVAVKSLYDKLSSLVPATTTINNRALTADVTITAADVGLGNTQNVSDANLPVNAQYAALIANYASSIHTHNVSDFNVPVATTSVKGVTQLSTSNTSATEPVSAENFRTIEANIVQDVAGLDSYADTNLLPITQFGDGSYLPIPAVGSFEASSHSTQIYSMTVFVSPDAKLILLRNGADIANEGVYYAYGDLGDDGKISNFVCTANRFTPPWLTSNQWVRRALRCTDRALLYTVTDGTDESLIFAIHNNTMDPTYHDVCTVEWDLPISYLKNSRHASRMLPFIQDDQCYILYIGERRISSFVTLSVFKAPLADVKAGGTVRFERITLTGNNLHNTPQDTTEYRLIVTSMTTNPAVPALYLNGTGSGNTGNLLHSSCMANSVVNDAGVLRGWIGGQGNQWVPARESHWAYGWALDFQIDLLTGTVTNPTFDTQPLVIDAQGAVSGQLVASSGLATPASQWDYEAGLDYVGGRFIAWKKHWTYGETLYSARSNDTSLTLTQIFTRGTRSIKLLYGTGVQPVFGSPVQDHQSALGVVDDSNGVPWMYGRNINGGKLWRSRFKLYGDYEYTPTLKGYGPSDEREVVASNEWYAVKRLVSVVEGDHAVGAGAVITDAFRTNRIDFDGTLTITATDALVDSILAAGRAQAGLTPVWERWALMVPRDPSIPATLSYWYGYPNGTYAITRLVAWLVTLPSRVGDLDSMTLGAIIRNDDLNGSAASMNWSERELNSPYVVKLTDGKVLCVQNYAPMISYIGWIGQFAWWMVIDPTTLALTSSGVNQYDARFNIKGMLGFPRFGQCHLTHDATVTSVLANAYGFETENLTTLQEKVMLISTQVLSSTKIYITDTVVYTAAGKRFTVPATTLDITDTYPSYADKTFYIYVDVSSDAAYYFISTSKLADTTTRTYVGYAKTDATKVVELVVNRATNLRGVRNLTEHFSQTLAHGITAVSKTAAGLDLVENLPLIKTVAEYEASKLAGTLTGRYVSDIVARIKGSNSKTYTMLHGVIVSGGTIPLPSGFSHAQCRCFVFPVEVPQETVGVTAFGVSVNQSTRVVTGRYHTADGRVVEMEVGYVIVGTDDTDIFNSWSI